LPKVLNEIYGVGILFFYYMKYIILFGWPLLRYGLDYKDNVIMRVKARKLVAENLSKVR